MYDSLEWNEKKLIQFPNELIMSKKTSSILIAEEKSEHNIPHLSKTIISSPKVSQLPHSTTNLKPDISAIGGSITMGNQNGFRNHHNNFLRSTNGKLMDSSMSMRDINGFQGVDTEELELRTSKHPEQKPAEAYLNIKVRGLDQKLKKYKLDLETLRMESKQNLQQQKKKNNFYQKYLKENYPQIFNDLQKKYHELQVLNDSCSSSQQNETDEILMPVQAQILQVKMESKKVCDKLQQLQAQVCQLRLANMQLSQKVHSSYGNTRMVLKKSDQLMSIISQSQNSNFSQGQSCLCVPLKKYILNFHRKLQNIAC